MSSPRKYEREVTMTDQEYGQRNQGVRKRKRSGKIFNPGALDDEGYEENETKKGLNMAGNRVGFGKSIESIKRARALYDHQVACRTRHMEPTDSDEEYPTYRSERNVLAEAEPFIQGFEAQYGTSNQPIRNFTTSSRRKANRQPISTGDFPSVGFTSMNHRANPSVTLQKESYAPYSSMMGSKRSHKFGFNNDMPPERHVFDPLHRHYPYDTAKWNYKQGDKMVNQDPRLQFPHHINPLGTKARHNFHRYNPYQPSPTEYSNDVQHDFSDTEEGDDDEEYFFETRKSQSDYNMLQPGTLRRNKEDDTLGAGNSWIQRYRRSKEGANATTMNSRDSTRREDLQNSFLTPEERYHLPPVKNINEMRKPKSRVPENITIVSNSSSLDHETTKLRAAALSRFEGQPPDIERKTRQISDYDSHAEKSSPLDSWPKFYFGSGTPGSSAIDFHLLVLTEESFQRSPLVTSLMMDDHVYTAQPIKNQEQLQNAHYGDLEAIARGFASIIQNRDRRSFISVEFVDYDKLENSGSFLLVIGVLDIDDEDVQKKISIGCVVTIVRGTLKGSMGIVKEIADSKVLLVMTENCESVTRWIPRKNIEVMDDLKILQHFESSVSKSGIAHSEQQDDAIYSSRHQPQREKNRHQLPDSRSHDARNDNPEHVKFPQTHKPLTFDSKASAETSAGYSPNKGEDSNSCIFTSEFYNFDDEDKVGRYFDATFASILGDESVCFPDEKRTNVAMETQIQDQNTVMQGTNTYHNVTHSVAESTFETNALRGSGSMGLTNDVLGCTTSQEENTSGGNTMENHYVPWKENAAFLVDTLDANSIHCPQVKQSPESTEAKMNSVNVCEEDPSKLGREPPPSKRKPIAAIALTKRRFENHHDTLDLRMQSVMTMSEFDMPPETVFKVFVNVNQDLDKGQSSNPLEERYIFTEAEQNVASSVYNNTVGEKQINDSHSAWKFIESMSVLELKDKLKCMKLPANGRRQQLFEKLVTALMVDKNTPIDELPDMITKFNP